MAFVAGLPRDLAAPVLVVLHVPAGGTSRLPEILARSGTLPTALARAGQRLEPGRLLVAPKDRHLLVREDRVLVERGPKENGHRPAVDALFRSAARWLGPHAVAVVLSGTLDDGAAGAAAVALQGGSVLVQDPSEALFSGMPRAALSAVPTAGVAAAEDLGRRLPDLLRAAGSRPSHAPTDDLVLETDMAEMDEGAVSSVETPGRSVPLSCPECHGAMSEVETGGAVHYRCHVGHAYGPASLLDAQERVSEAALWTALASLEERAAVHRELASRRPEAAPDHQRRAAEIDEQTRALRRQLRRRPA